MRCSKKADGARGVCLSQSQLSQLEWAKVELDNYPAALIIWSMEASPFNTSSKAGEDMSGSERPCGNAICHLPKLFPSPETLRQDSVIRCRWGHQVRHTDCPRQPRLAKVNGSQHLIWSRSWQWEFSFIRRVTIHFTTWGKWDLWRCSEHTLHGVHKPCLHTQDWVGLWLN